MPPIPPMSMSDGAAVPRAIPEVDAPQDVRSRMTLATRTALLTAGVAVLTVLVSGLVAYPLVRQSANVQARASLAQQADIIVGLLGGERPGNVPEGELRDRVQALDEQGIVGYVIRDGAVARSPLLQADFEELLEGRLVSVTRDTAEGLVLVEGRPLRGRQGIVLVQQAQVATAPATALLRRMLLALAVGLVLSALVGWLASRRVTRSLTEAARAAERLSTGERDVRLTPAGPAEVAEIAESLNRLAAALAVSENRQRAFLMSVSHELRTPLTAVKGYAEALKDGVVTGDEVGRTGAILVGESDRLERLVSDLLELSRAGAVDLRLNMSEVDLREFALSAGDVWGDRCDRDGVLFHLEAPTEPLRVVSDPLRLRQIVDNLAENALRVTPAGAPIVLSVRAEGADHAVIEVRDGGPGLTEDDLSVAFVPEELHSRYRGVRQVGTGIGLALVGGLAGRLGGSAEAGHASEGGARFTVTIPRRRT